MTDTWAAITLVGAPQTRANHTATWAGERLIVWCDDEPEEGALHATFRLRAAGESVALFGPVYGDPHALQDARSFRDLGNDVSVGAPSDNSTIVSRAMFGYLSS